MAGLTLLGSAPGSNLRRHLPHPYPAASQDPFTVQAP